MASAYVDSPYTNTKLGDAPCPNLPELIRVLDDRIDATRMLKEQFDTLADMLLGGCNVPVRDGPSVPVEARADGHVATLWELSDRLQGINNELSALSERFSKALRA